MRVKQTKTNFRVSDSKCQVLFFDFGLVNRSVTFYFPTLSYQFKSKKNLRVSNWKFNLIVHKVVVSTQKEEFL